MACLPLILPLLPEMMALAAGSSARVGRGCPAPEEPVPAQPAAPQGWPCKRALRLVQPCPVIFPTEELHVA